MCVCVRGGAYTLNFAECIFIVPSTSMYPSQVMITICVGVGVGGGGGGGAAKYSCRALYGFTALGL